MHWRSILFLVSKPDCKSVRPLNSECFSFMQFLASPFFCVNYKALGKRRMWLRLSIKCSFQLRNPTPEIETLLWRGMRGRVVEGSIACSPLLLRPLSSCPWPVNRCSCSCCSISFSISLLFCARQEKGQAGGMGEKRGTEGGGRWRELTYKSSNGHSLWFGLAAPPPSLVAAHVSIFVRNAVAVSPTRNTLHHSGRSVCACVCVCGGHGQLMGLVWVRFQFELFSVLLLV